MAPYPVVSDGRTRSTAEALFQAFARFPPIEQKSVEDIDLMRFVLALKLKQNLAWPEYVALTRNCGSTQIFAARDTDAASYAGHSLRRRLCYQAFLNVPRAAGVSIMR